MTFFYTEIYATFRSSFLHLTGILKILFHRTFAVWKGANVLMENDFCDR